MLRFVDQSRTIGRREFLRLGAVGLGLAGLHSSAAQPRRNGGAFGKAKSVVLVYASGGQSQIDTWDPKPDAPEEIRGDFRTIATAIPGVRLCEHLPHTARVANLFTILRSVSHDDLDHGSATYLALTGRFHAKKSGNPLPSPNDQPTYGAVLHRVRPARHFPNSAVHINGPAQVPEILAPGQFAGALGRGCEPLLIGDPSGDGVAVRGLDPLPELPPVRVDSRRSLLESLDRYRVELDGQRAVGEMAASYRQAYDLLAARQVRSAFDLSREPRTLRERYGLNRSGQSLLLARRLVEAGVPWITVIWNHNNRGQDKRPDSTDDYGWDTHNDIFEALKVHLLPRFDQSFSAFLLDLEQRGLLDSTLVVCMGEFGRAPHIALERNFAGSSPGRKHWASVYSIVAAGAGVMRGGVVGSSDRMGAYPQEHPVGPWDVAATMFAALGVDPSMHYTDAAGRLFTVTDGRPIDALWS